MIVTTHTIADRAEALLETSQRVDLASRWLKRPALDRVLGALPEGAEPTVRLLIRARTDADLTISDRESLLELEQNFPGTFRVRCAADLEEAWLVTDGAALEGTFSLTPLGGFCPPRERHRYPSVPAGKQFLEPEDVARIQARFDEAWQRAVPLAEQMTGMARKPEPFYLPEGHLHLGVRQPDPEASGEEASKPEALLLPASNMNRHALIMGATGSGKTALGIALLEELALNGTPAVVIDTNGDLTNLALRFADISGDDLEPWIDAEQAMKAGLSPKDFARAEAGRWQLGLAKSGVPAERPGRLIDRSAVTILTPGDPRGVPLKLFSAFRRPEGDVSEKRLRARAQRKADDLLDILVHVRSDERLIARNLIYTIIETAWKAGRDLSFAELIRRVRDPGIDSLGALPLDEAYPERRRASLQKEINTIYSNPDFVDWSTGVPLDFDQLLRTPEGKPRLTVFYLAHLDDTRRTRIAATALGELCEWMQSDSPGSGVRAAVFFDEVYGFVPPHPQNPPTKEPLIRLVKQGRKYGISLILATQNPVDVDYAVFSNTHTFCIGTISRDDLEARNGMLRKWLRDDMKVDPDRIPRLQDRTFLRTTLEEEPAFFRSRHVISYLRGPLVPADIARLSIDRYEGGRWVSPDPGSTAPAEAADESGKEPTTKPPEETPETSEKGRNVSPEPDSSRPRPTREPEPGTVPPAIEEALNDLWSKTGDAWPDWLVVRLDDEGWDAGARPRTPSSVPMYVLPDREPAQVPDLCVRVSAIYRNPSSSARPWTSSTWLRLDLASADDWKEAASAGRLERLEAAPETTAEAPRPVPWAEAPPTPELLDEIGWVVALRGKEEGLLNLRWAYGKKNTHEAYAPHPGELDREERAEILERLGVSGEQPIPASEGPEPAEEEKAAEPESPEPSEDDRAREQKIRAEIERLGDLLEQVESNSPRGDLIALKRGELRRLLLNRERKEKAPEQEPETTGSTARGVTWDTVSLRPQNVELKVVGLLW